MVGYWVIKIGFLSIQLDFFPFCTRANNVQSYSICKIQKENSGGVTKDSTLKNTIRWYNGKSEFKLNLPDLYGMNYVSSIQPFL